MTSHVFGPVPSRRLGRSLGVDLVPFKTCSYDCVYCQLGPTTCRTIERKGWVCLGSVVADLERRLSSKPDYITLSGSGEPTLHSQVSKLIAKIKAVTEEISKAWIEQMPTMASRIMKHTFPIREAQEIPPRGFVSGLKSAIID